MVTDDSHLQDLDDHLLVVGDVDGLEHLAVLPPAQLSNQLVVLLVAGRQRGGRQEERDGGERQEERDEGDRQGGSEGGRETGGETGGRQTVGGEKGGKRWVER